MPVLLFWACASRENQADEIILVKIDEKKISAKEFLLRSEMAVRPHGFKSKRATLNNLISEKILAREAEGNGELLRNRALQATLNGIKEQSMRDKLYEEIALKNVRIDSQEVLDAYKLSMREYKLEFYTMQNAALAEKISAVLDSVPQLSGEVFKGLGEALGKKPVHTVNYKDQDDEILHEALFTKPLELGAVIGPMKLSNGENIIMRVLDWADYPVIGGEDQRIRWKKVEKKISQTKAGKLWRSYQTNLMKGKIIKFEREAFYTLSSWAMKKYLSSNENDSLKFSMDEIPPAGPEIDLDAPFCTINDEVWSVNDFKKELMSHPLVFRTKDLNKNNFAEQFKFAVVDMVRDHFLTQEAYKKSLDDSEDIRKTVEMWRDAYLAISQQKSVVRSAVAQGIIKEDDKPGMRKYWESYLLDLQKKYGSSIQVNNGALDKISLTNVDFVAIRPGVPYPIAVPAFPTLVLSDNLDYAKQKERF